MANLLRYAPFDLQFKPYVNIGFFNAIALKKTNTNTILDKPLDDPIIIVPAIEDVRILEQGLVFGLGIIWKHINVEARFENGNGMSPSTYLSSRTYSYQILLNYRF